MLLGLQEILDGCPAEHQRSKYAKLRVHIESDEKLIRRIEDGRIGRQKTVTMNQ